MRNEQLVQWTILSRARNLEGRQVRGTFLARELEN